MRFPKKSKKRLESRRKDYDAMKTKRGGYKRPGSLNSHK